MALGFGLMSLASAIVGLVVVSDEQAKHDVRQFVDATTLESAIEAGLFGLEKDGVPQAGEWFEQQRINGLEVRLLFASTEHKPDIGKDGAAPVAAALSDAGLRQRVSAAFVPGKPGDQPPVFTRFSDFVAAAGADAAEEDCLRRRLTLGRVGGQPTPIPPDTGLIPPRQPLTAGDVIDVRAEIVEPDGERSVLWRRVRFTGRPERPWLTHDWRQLHLGRSDIDCAQMATAAPSFSDFRLSH
ncbi:MAG TPA: hypothetical protein VHW60_16165 [Caulobacteraceae bacterium]|jgi:hypothetical protein|nr:hypothetical protein [Caulobacteraceae bacterium]